MPSACGRVHLSARLAGAVVAHAWRAERERSVSDCGERSRPGDGPGLRRPAVGPPARSAVGVPARARGRGRGALASGHGPHRLSEQRLRAVRQPFWDVGCVPGFVLGVGDLGPGDGEAPAVLARAGPALKQRGRRYSGTLWKRPELWLGDGVRSATASWVSPEQAGSRAAGERGAAWQGGQRGRRTAQERQVGREEGRLAPWPGGLGCFLKVARSHPRCRVWEGCGCVAFVRLKYVFGEGTSKDRRPEVGMSEQDGTPTPWRAGRGPGWAGRGRGRPGDRPCEEEAGE